MMKKMITLALITLLIGLPKLSTADPADKTHVLEATKSAVRLEMLWHVEVPVLDKKGKVVGSEIETREGVCSGNYISPNLVLTNRHCADENPIITIVTQDEENRDAEILYLSPTSDLALLHTKEAHSSFIPVAKNNPEVGDTVYAFGQPLGIPFVLTKGIVSKIHPTGNHLLLDLTIVFGNSGSALINEKGELVGVVNAAYSLNPFIFIPAGLNVAVSNQAVREVLDKFAMPHEKHKA